MNVDSIKNGIVLDHIKAGTAMDIYHYLNLDSRDCTIAIIRNVASKNCGKKDIIKIDEELDINLELLGYIDNEITVNIIKDGKIIKKFHPELPEKVENVLTCKNPRCITSTERGIKQIFKLTDKDARVYRCIYCESSAKGE